MDEVKHSHVRSTCSCSISSGQNVVEFAGVESVLNSMIWGLSKRTACTTRAKSAKTVGASHATSPLGMRERVRFGPPARCFTPRLTRMPRSERKVSQVAQRTM